MENNPTNQFTNENHAPRSRSRKKQQKPKFTFLKLIRNIIIVIILLLASLFILDKAPNYKNSDTADQTNLIINNSNITTNKRPSKDINYNDWFYNDMGKAANLGEAQFFASSKVIVSVSSSPINLSRLSERTATE